VSAPTTTAGSPRIIRPSEDGGQDRGALVLRMRLPGSRRNRPRTLSGRLATREMLVWSALAALTAAVSFLALMLGEIDYSPAQVVQALLGGGSPAAELFVVQFRLPRAVCAVVFGAMLGVAGALFQGITRNPLGSPDIIGFTASASAGGVAMLAFVGSGYYLVAAGALGGGFVVAGLIVLLSRGGGVAGFRLVIAGIAISAMLASLQTWLVLSADLELAQVAALWSTGTLNGASFGYAGPALLGGVLTLLLAIPVLGPRLGMLDLGDDAAAALGLAPGRTRLLAIVTGVVLVALATSAAGPIAFVALAAPHVGRRLAGTAGTSLASSACAGAMVLASADLAAQHAVPGQSYPVGLVTVAVGGLYLISLIVQENRKGSL